MRRRARLGTLLLWRRAHGFGLPRDGDAVAGYGITATKRLGGAVVRNRCKRIVRDLFRRHQHVLSPGLDVIVSARPSMPRVGTADLEKRFLKTLRRIAGEPSVQQ